MSATVEEHAVVCRLRPVLRDRDQELERLAAERDEQKKQVSARTLQFSLATAAERDRARHHGHAREGADRGGHGGQGGAAGCGE
jgi:hypothetical protein